MHDDIRPRLSKQPLDQPVFRKIPFREREAFVFLQLRQSRALERRVIVIVHAVNPGDAIAAQKQPLRQVIADEARGPRDQYGLFNRFGQCSLPLAADGIVFHAAFFHVLGIKDIAPVVDKRHTHRPAEYLRREADKLLPLREDKAAERALQRLFHAARKLHIRIAL
ncbi:hypothetical protein SDC9_185529 [bioreactor metagenome]|uniref:Uncharacterized protein n=1 Tax=bioreactor metagenome TaxID=1076179 RepID=A0A645HG40_9ZZZZ